MFKAYSDNEDNFTGHPSEDFDQKSLLFLEMGQQAEIYEEKQKHKGFSIMIAGDTRKFYFQKLRSRNLDSETLAIETRERFQTEQRTRFLFREWDDISLNNVCRRQSDKYMYDCLQFLTVCLPISSRVCPSSIKMTLLCGKNFWMQSKTYSVVELHTKSPLRLYVVLLLIYNHLFALLSIWNLKKTAWQTT